MFDFHIMTLPNGNVTDVKNLFKEDFQGFRSRKGPKNWSRKMPQFFFHKVYFANVTVALTMNMFYQVVD